ncbi:hypothetical protein SNE40_006214 [Patella caerulea]|uniref:Chorein N-terminal domain-containing protein n=1 Tax=Patella caerulea TaxID=87958 RepID=A0AAN8PZL0_PATCE
MFAIASYITPLLMGYLDKYVELRQEDFKINFWEGDATLKTVKLRTDFFEKLLQIPVIFKSGQIKELKIYVPWHKINSEPIVITLKTVECVLKVRDTAYDDNSSSHSSEQVKKQLQAAKAKQKLKRTDSEVLPPGYMQGMISRILNNITLVIDNLVIKFVEDDIVLSVNVMSAECYPVDINWNRAFVDFNPPEFTSRKVLKFCDLTVCMDRADASGNIQSYEQPLLFKCIVACRILMTYDSVNAKLPKLTRFNLFCEELKATISDNQLPIFIRLIELCIALYYGVIHIPVSEKKLEPDKQEVTRSSADETNEAGNEVNAYGQGWGEWAWSFVVAEEEEESSETTSSVDVKPVVPVVSIGFYIHNATIQLQLSEKIKESEKFKGKNRLFHPFLFLQMEGLSAEILLHGMTFFNAQCGITWFKVQTRGPCVCGENDAEDQRSAMLLSGGERLATKTNMNYISNSLFDSNSPECQGRTNEYLVTEDSHLKAMNEEYSMHRYGAFWFDYLFNWQKEEEKVGSGSSRSSISSDNSEPVFQRENAIMRFVFGSTRVNLTSTFLHRVQKIVSCATNHQYEPYGTPKTGEREEERLTLSDDDIKSLDEFIPTRCTQVTLLHPVIVAMVPEHEKWNVSKKSYKPNKKSKESKSKVKSCPLPAICVSATRFDFKVTIPMYPWKLVRMISNLTNPSSNLLHHCHTHTLIQISDVHAGLQKIDADGTTSHLHTVVSPCSPIIKIQKLTLPKYWSSSSIAETETMVELNQLSVSLTKATVMLLVRQISSWLTMIPQLNQYQHDSLLDDIFTPQSGTIFIPVVDVTLNDLEIKHCRTSLVDCYTGRLASLQLVLYTKDSGVTRVMPILYGPSDTSNLEKCDTLMKKDLQSADITDDVVVVTLQIPHNTHISQAPAVLLFGLEGFAVYADPGLISWLDYSPHLVPMATKVKEVEVDIALAHAASPLQNISQVSLPSSSSVTQQTSSKPLTQSQMISPNTLSSVIESSTDSKDRTSFWANWFPLFRKLNVQVDVKSSILYLSNETMNLDEPSMDISSNINTGLLDHRLNQLLVIYLPTISIHSSDLKRMTVLQTLPIQMLEGSLIGDKLPWNVQISNLTVYSIHDNTTCLPILGKLDIKSTVAVSCTYTTPTSQNISTLGLCLHVDVHPLSLSISQKQIAFGNSVLKNVLTLINNSSKLVNFCIKNLHIEKSSVTKEVQHSSPKKKAESGVSCDEDVVLEMSEDASGSDSPVHDSSGSDASDTDVKLTLWTQLLLPKISVNFYSLMSPNTDSCVSLVLEDLTLSVDVEKIYSKTKITLNTVNINHYQKQKEEKAWSTGCCQGIIMSCLGELSRDVHIVSNKFWSSEVPPISLFPSHDPVQRDKTHGFLSITFTRALCKNNNKRLKKQGVDVPTFIQMDNASGQCELYFHKYISEICLNMDPCDIIVYPPVLQSLLTVFEKGGKNVESLSATRKMSAATPVNNDITFLAAHMLPLLYINLSNLRIFLPKADVKTKEQTLDSDSADGKNNQSTLNHDLLVVQLNSVSINSHADNPLPRYPIRKDMYDWAVMSGFTQHPSSCIEDRQYQVDIKGLTMCTGNWSDFIECINKTVDNNTTYSSVQIPALEWNTCLSLQQKDKEDIKLIPVALPFDLKVVAAPAIVYEKKLDNQSRNQQILVCGFNMEVNVTSDLDLYISTNQIQLISTVLTNCVQIVQSKSRTKKSTTGSQKTRQQDFAFDSGVESDISTVLNDSFKFQPHPVPSVSSDIELRSKVTPFEVLLTADRISCTLYTHKHLEDDFHPVKIKNEETVNGAAKGSKTKFDWKRDNLSSNGNGDDDVDSNILQPSDSSTNFGFLKVHRDSAASNHDIMAGTICIKPFLYVYIAQPYTVLACSSSSQKFEMSCYDIIIRGSESQLLIPVSESQIIPDCADFSLYWVETRPGQPHLKTGIPPCLFTVQIKDFLQEPACVMLRLERPLKANIDLQKVQQVQDFIEGITLMSVKTNKDRTEQTPSSSDVTTPSILSHIDHIEVVTEQIVVTMETVPNSGAASCVLSTSRIRVDSEFQHNSTGAIETITGRYHVKDVLLTTVYNSRCLPLLGPTSLFLETIFYWTKHSGHPNIPKTLVAMETDLITVNFGQEHLLCLEAVVNNIKKFLSGNKKLKERSDVETPSCDDIVNVIDEEAVFISDVSHDDFKSGSLAYISAPDGSDIHPSGGEIIFSKSKETNGNGGMMTWCYHQSRVIQSISVSPVPFNTQDDITHQVSSVLQYWDTATRQFMDYIKFNLSESETTSLDLPAIHPCNTRDLISSQMWRIIITVTTSNIQEEDISIEEAVILPTSLLGCIKLDTCFIPSLIPVYQLSIILSAVDLRLYNHLLYTNKDIPNKLKPFHFVPDEVTEEEFAVIRLDSLTATANHIEGLQKRTSIQVGCSVSVDVVEFENLTMIPVLQANTLTADVNLLHTEKPRVYEINSRGESVKIQVGKGTVHTINTSLQTWLPVLKKEEIKCTPIFSHYIICNDTQQTLHFGQVGTDENIVLQSRQMYKYNWRSHKIKQALHLCVDSSCIKWCDAFDVLKTGTIVRVVRSKEENYTVIVKIKQLSNTQKQIIFTGQLVMSSRLSQNIEVKLVTSKDQTVNETLSVIGAGQTMPSYVIEHEEVREIKLRLTNVQSSWSQEIHVNGDKMKSNRLIKIPLANKSSYIHIWCRIFCQHYKNAVQNMVLLTPLYVIRTHLPRPLLVDMASPKLQEHQQLEVIGQAREYQLHCVGGDISHALAFRLGADMEKSSPPLIISTGLIDQIETTKIEQVDIDDLCTPSTSDLSMTWPYCFDNGNVHTGESNPYMMSTCNGSDVIQPSVELNVRLSEYITGCSTLLIDIAPEILLVNLSTIRLQLLANTQTYPLDPSQTFTLPKLQKEEFELGYIYNDEVIKSDIIPLSSDDMSSKLYSSEIGRVLFIDGIVHTTIILSSQVLFLTLKSELHHGMRVISIKESYCMSNLTNIPITTQLITLPLGSSKISLQDKVSAQESIPSQKSSVNADGNLHPLLFWSQYSTHDIQPQKNNYTQYIHYISIKQDDHQSASAPTASQWSIPIRIAANKDGIRHTLAIPDLSLDEYTTQPFCLTAQTKNGVTYLVLMEDHSPVCFLRNNCPFPLIYGQTLMNITLSGMTVQEEAELVERLPMIPSGGTSYYTMPNVNSNYPVIDSSKYPRIHFSSLLGEKDGVINHSPWSLGVDLAAGNTFIKLPQVADLKVKIKKTSGIFEVELEPVGKAEISAREIRSRLKGGNITFTVSETDKKPIESETGAELKPIMKSKKSSVKDTTDIMIGCNVDQFSLVVLDELSSQDTVGEVIHLNMEDLFIGTYPVASQDKRFCLAVCVGNVHLDNQLYGLGQFDFPVILLPQGKTKRLSTAGDIDNLSVIEKHAICKLSSFVNFQVVLSSDSLDHSVLESLDLSVKPISVYIDDMYIYRILKEIEILLPTILSTNIPEPITWRYLHSNIKQTATCLSQPIRIQHLSIQPIKMLLSVHASLKLFLAADHTPLSFGGFERNNLSTTNYQLIRALAMHYASAAIFRAGIVIGSLEILGNPTGLVRSVGIGVADLFRMPYAGLTRGPGAFVSGVSNGMGSLLRNVSAGMITSVTNLASSVSRNMDRLSMDSNHLQRQEDNRRNRPVGVSDGLVQGLTGFGISLLGAVAGLADQPLQSVLTNQGESDRRSSTSAVASGLVTGMGKGLVGIVTKPIGGAAELVSQAGQGLLYGTGLGQLPERLVQPSSRSKSFYSNAVIKYPMKIFSTLPRTNFLLTVEACHLDMSGSEVMVTLILTSDILFVVNNDEDAQQQAFSLSELECCDNVSDPTLISLLWTDNSYKANVEAGNSNKDRVAAFVSSAATFAQPTNEDTPGTDSQSDGTTTSIMTAPQYDFHVNEEYRNLFISLFKLVKLRIQGKGFSVI